MSWSIIITRKDRASAMTAFKEELRHVPIRDTISIAAADLLAGLAEDGQTKLESIGHVEPAGSGKQSYASVRVTVG